MLYYTSLNSKGNSRSSNLTREIMLFYFMGFPSHHSLPCLPAILLVRLIFGGLGGSRISHSSFPGISHSHFQPLTSTPSLPSSLVTCHCVTFVSLSPFISFQIKKWNVHYFLQILQLQNSNVVVSFNSIRAKQVVFLLKSVLSFRDFSTWNQLMPILSLKLLNRLTA